MTGLGSDLSHLRTTSWSLLVLLATWFVVLLIRTAWLSDQAYLTLRSVSHLSLGQGLRFNVSERVLAFDHPLWALVLALAHRVTGELYWTPLLAGALASTVAIVVLLRQAPSDERLVLCGLLVCLSPAFVAYSTSGLSNPLVHLALVAFFAIGLERRGSTFLATSAYVVAGLTVLADPLAVLLVLPLLVRDTALRGLRRSVPFWMLGLAPAMGWAVWASWYYGTPLPNPWLALLGDGRPVLDRVQAGLEYLRASVLIDPVMALGLTLGGTAAWRTGGADRWVLAGVIAFVAAVVACGGDQWAGRVLTAPFVVAVLLMNRSPQLQPRLAVVLCGVVIALGIAVSSATLRSDADFGLGTRMSRGASDQRRADYQATGLLLERRGRATPAANAAVRRPGVALSHHNVVVTPVPGFTGMAAGADVHVIDPQGLTDPLLARLPAAVAPRRAGVQDRRIPDGYLDVLGGRGVSFGDSQISALYRDIVGMTQGDLANHDRLVTAWRLSTGQLSSLLRQSSYGPRQVSADVVGIRRADGTLADAAGVIPIREGGVVITFSAPTVIKALELSVSGNDAYLITVLHGDRELERHTLPADILASGALVTRPVTLTAPQRATAVQITCVFGDGTYALGHLRVVP